MRAVYSEKQNPADLDHQGNTRQARIPNGNTFLFYAHEQSFFFVYRGLHVLSGQSSRPYSIRDKASAIIARIITKILWQKVGMPGKKKGR